jgi:hypothetical protein
MREAAILSLVFRANGLFPSDTGLLTRFPGLPLLLLLLLLLLFASFVVGL